MHNFSLSFFFISTGLGIRLICQLKKNYVENEKVTLLTRFHFISSPFCSFPDVLLASSERHTLDLSSPFN